MVISMKNELEMDARKLNMVLDMTSNLTPEQLAAVAEHIMNLMASTKIENRDTCHALVYESRPSIPDCYITGDHIYSRPAVPQCA